MAGSSVSSELVGTWKEVMLLVLLDTQHKGTAIIWKIWNNSFDDTSLHKVIKSASMYFKHIFPLLLNVFCTVTSCNTVTILSNDMICSVSCDVKTVPVPQH